MQDTSVLKLINTGELSPHGLFAFPINNRHITTQTLGKSPRASDE